MMGGESKKQRVEGMFDEIAPTYDALNHLFSLGIDREWRRKLVSMVVREAGLLHLSTPRNDGDAERHCEEWKDEAIRNYTVLDVATGTADLAISLARRIPSAQVTGVDISERMLAGGREKVSRRGLAGRVVLQVGDAEALTFADGAFDCVTVAFGVRNFGDIQTGLGEMCRVLRCGGRCFVLEFSQPTVPVFGGVYRFYFHRVMPWVGRLVSRNRTAYDYLPNSVDDFPTPGRFAEMLCEAGFSSVRTRRLTFGVAYVYEALKL